MSVGAIRRRFGWLSDASSNSLSLVSRLVPAPDCVGPEGRGVSGGVAMGTPVTFPELAAAMLGTWPAMSGGLVRTPAATADA
jgi:hypothetical protein